MQRESLQLQACDKIRFQYEIKIQQLQGELVNRRNLALMSAKDSEQQAYVSGLFNEISPMKKPKKSGSADSGGECT